MKDLLITSVDQIQEKKKVKFLTLMSTPNTQSGQFIGLSFRETKYDAFTLSFLVFSESLSRFKVRNFQEE